MQQRCKQLELWKRCTKFGEEHGEDEADGPSANDQHWQVGPGYGSAAVIRGSRGEGVDGHGQLSPKA